MAWNARLISLTLGSDVHCGDRPLGFVARTFPFVPCHIPFFALVPAAVRLLGMKDERASYKTVEDLFANCLRCTPLYIAEENSPIFPWGEGLRVIESRYLGSRQGVKLDLRTRSAENGKLFETEVILATPRRRASGPASGATKLQGALFWQAGRAEGHGGTLSLSENGTLEWNGTSVSLEEALKTIRLGGDRTRSLGLVADASLSPLPNEVLWNCAFRLDGDWPELSLPAGEKCPLPICREGAEDERGLPVILTGRRYKEKKDGSGGSGLAMDSATPAWQVGWQAPRSMRVSLRFPRAAKAEE